jgi:hypothetical protein
MLLTSSRSDQHFLLQDQEVNPSKINKKNLIFTNNLQNISVLAGVAHLFGRMSLEPSSVSIRSMTVIKLLRRSSRAGRFLASRMARTGGHCSM